MNIDTPLRELGTVDSAALRDAILAQDDAAWEEDKTRQGAFEVHRNTKSIVLVFADLDRWPEIVVSQEAGWPRLSGVALPLMNDIISVRSPHSRSNHHQPTRPIHDRRPALSTKSWRSVRAQQSKNALSHEQGK